MKIMKIMKIKKKNLYFFDSHQNIFRPLPALNKYGYVHSSADVRKICEVYLRKEIPTSGTISNVPINDMSNIECRWVELTAVSVSNESSRIDLLVFNPSTASDFSNKTIQSFLDMEKAFIQGRFYNIISVKDYIVSDLEKKMKLKFRIRLKSQSQSQ